MATSRGDMIITQVETDLRVVMHPAGYGRKAIQVVGLKWVESQPFMADGRWTRYHYDITLENLWSQAESVTTGLWWEPWWMEGGWNDCLLEGFEQRTCRGAVRVPAEQETNHAMLHLAAFGKHHYLPGLAMETVQNPDALIPIGSPATYSAWSGLKDFPVPYSHYQPGFQIKAIRLPYPSGQGELIVDLLSPSDYDKFVGQVCFMSPTEKRCGLSRISIYPVNRYLYIINISGTKGIQLVLTEDDPSGLYTIPFEFSKASGKHPVTISATIWVGGDPEGHYLFWSPEVYRYHRYCLLGYIM
ncbi:hypothetical protein ES703_105060 [subsurface metagenome]